MTDERIDPTITAEVKRQWVALRASGDPDEERFIEAAIRVADRERGLKEERKLRMAGAPEEPWVLMSRLASDWRQVERGGEDG